MLSTIIYAIATGALMHFVQLVIATIVDGAAPRVKIRANENRLRPVDYLKTILILVSSFFAFSLAFAKFIIPIWMIISKVIEVY